MLLSINLGQLRLSLSKSLEVNLSLKIAHLQFDTCHTFRSSQLPSPHYTWLAFTQ